VWVVMIDIETHFILISDLLHIYNQHLLQWLVVTMLTHPDISALGLESRCCWCLVLELGGSLLVLMIETPDSPPTSYSYQVFFIHI